MNAYIDFLCTPQHSLGREIKHLFNSFLIWLHFYSYACKKKKGLRLKDKIETWSYILDLYCQSTTRALCCKRLTLSWR
jgi:hypothetical protein